MSTISLLHIPLTAHHMRFTVRAVTPIEFNEFKGSALRGAFTSVLGQTFCPEWRQGARDPAHMAVCPACQLVALERDESTSGDVRRPYAITPPPGDQRRFEVGDTFAFGMTLFGAPGTADVLTYLPYLVLAVGGMGEFGVGRRVERGGGAGGEGRGGGGAKGRAARGRFMVERIDALNPFTGDVLSMLEPGDGMVRGETLPLRHEEVMAAADGLAQELAAHDNLLHVDFLTPTRVLQNKQTWKQPDFFALGKQVVLRVMDLSAQHGGGRPTMEGDPIELRRHIYPALDSVQLVNDQTHWWDLSGYSGRLQQEQKLGGLMGRATYYAPDWRPLLP